MSLLWLTNLTSCEIFTAGLCKIISKTLNLRLQRCATKATAGVRHGLFQIFTVTASEFHIK